MEIESFVHGAMCYCYSGQCLMSSFNGGRSGNRGRCAQPCRLPYKVYDGQNIINNQDEKYALSPKDMCALKILPDVIDAGVYSLKIEGRMKNVTYAAYVTSIYRKYVDKYIANGRKGYRVSDKDIEQLKALWKQICDRFQGYDEHLIFEGVNEPRLRGEGNEWIGDAESREVVNQYAKGVRRNSPCFWRKQP